MASGPIEIGDYTTVTSEQAAWDLYAAHALEFYLMKNDPSDLIGPQFTLAVEAAATTADRLVEQRRRRCGLASFFAPT